MRVNGRAAIVVAERRLTAMRRGTRMLDRKQHILAEELDRLQREAAQAAAEWRGRANESKLWLQRAGRLEGADRFGESEPVGSADVEILWGATLGVRHPVQAKCSIPTAELTGGGLAVWECVRSHRLALAAAAESAAANRAVRLVNAELGATRRRQRVLEKRRIPRLEAELAAARQQLEQQELEESLRIRWAAGLGRSEALTPGQSKGGQR